MKSDDRLETTPVFESRIELNGVEVAINVRAPLRGLAYDIAVGLRQKAADLIHDFAPTPKAWMRPNGALIFRLDHELDPEFYEERLGREVHWWNHLPKDAVPMWPESAEPPE